MENDIDKSEKKAMKHKSYLKPDIETLQKIKKDIEKLVKSDEYKTLVSNVSFVNINKLRHNIQSINVEYCGLLKKHNDYQIIHIFDYMFSLRLGEDRCNNIIEVLDTFSGRIKAMLLDVQLKQALESEKKPNPPLKVT